MKPLIHLILVGLEARDIEEFEDDRPLWQRRSYTIPFIKFRATIRGVSQAEFVRRVVEVFHSQGFETSSFEVGQDTWHVPIEYHAETSRILITFNDRIVSVSSLPPSSR